VRPDSPTAWNNLAAAHLNKGRIREAVPVLERSIDIEDRANTRSNLGTAYYFLERYDDAVTHYQRAIELQSGSAVHHANLGDAWLKLGREQDSRNAFARAADLARDRAVRSPLDSAAQSALALYCAKAGAADCALEAGATAAELRPDDASIALDNAVVRCILDRDVECLEWLDHSVKLGITRSQIELMPELERLADDATFRKILDRAG
jgi:tetratricopeptide (TPR) repeat protein